MDINALSQQFMPTRTTDGGFKTNTFKVGVSDEKNDADLRMAAEGFEAIFLSTLLKSGRDSGFEDSLTGGSGVKTAQSLFDTKVSEITSSRSKLGIAEAVYRQMQPLIQKTER